MDTLGRNVSKNPLTITRRITRSMTRENRRENPLPIPIDLTIDIFSRLPARSIARCRCVSKPWASVLRRSDFKELFLTRSSARPQFLFACESEGELNIFSSPQPQNPDENSSLVVASYHKKISFHRDISEFSGHVHGLLCLTNERIIKGKEERVPVIYNPSTGQSLLVPQAKNSKGHVLTMLGYDPVGQQFKLLSSTASNIGLDNVYEEHQVLTLGNRKHSWRMIKCFRPHFCPSNEGICIDGVLYYTASESTTTRNSMVVCFDVRSEEFSFIQVPETFMRNWAGIPIKYNGKLGLLMRSVVNTDTESIEFCVLEDAEKHEWSKHTCSMPVSWRNLVGLGTLYVLGMTRTNEIVMVMHCQSLPFYVYYYNIERKTTTRLEIRGMEAFERKRIHIFLDHIENLKLM